MLVREEYPLTKSPSEEVQEKLEPRELGSAIYPVIHIAGYMPKFYNIRPETREAVWRECIVNGTIVPTEVGDDEAADAEGRYFFNLFDGTQKSPCQACTEICTFTAEVNQSYPLPVDCECRAKRPKGFVGDRLFSFLGAFRSYYLLLPRKYKLAKPMALPKGILASKAKMFPEQLLPSTIGAAGIMASLGAMQRKDVNVLVYSPLKNALTNNCVRKYPVLMRALLKLGMLNLPTELYSTLVRHGIEAERDLKWFITQYEEMGNNYYTEWKPQVGKPRLYIFQTTTPIVDRNQGLLYPEKDTFEEDPCFKNLPLELQDSLLKQNWIDETPPETGMEDVPTYERALQKVDATFKQNLHFAGFEALHLPYEIMYQHKLLDHDIRTSFITVRELKTEILHHAEMKVNSLAKQGSQEEFLQSSFDREDHEFLCRRKVGLQILAEEYLDYTKGQRQVSIDQMYRIMNWLHLVEMIELVTLHRKSNVKSLLREESVERRQKFLITEMSKSIRGCEKATNKFGEMKKPIKKGVEQLLWWTKQKRPLPSLSRETTKGSP